MEHLYSKLILCTDDSIYLLFYFIRPLTIEERAQEQASKKARHDEYVNVADSLGWRVMDPKKECMVMREKDTAIQFGELFMPRNRRDLIDVWDTS